MLFAGVSYYIDELYDANEGTKHSETPVAQVSEPTTKPEAGAEAIEPQSQAEPVSSEDLVAAAQNEQAVQADIPAQQVATEPASAESAPAQEPVSTSGQFMPEVAPAVPNAPVYPVDPVEPTGNVEVASAPTASLPPPPVPEYLKQESQRPLPEQQMQLILQTFAPSN